MDREKQRVMEMLEQGRITPDEAAATSEMFDLLLGDNLSGRKQYISDFGSQYLDLADIS